MASGRRRAARVAAALAALAGVVNLVSALLPAEADRLQVLDALVPGIVSEGATVITAAAGIGLCCWPAGCGGGSGGGGSPSRHGTRNQPVEDPEPVGFGRQQRRHQVEQAGQGGQGGGQPGGRPGTPRPAAPGGGSMHGRRVGPGGRDRGRVAGHHGSGPPRPGAG